jgi:hypothetical protein
MTLFLALADHIGGLEVMLEIDAGDRALDALGVLGWARSRTWPMLAMTT